MEDFNALVQDIHAKIRSYSGKGLKLFVTSSFQPQSPVLLHIISQVDKSIPIYFLNTGYHFPETLAFKEQLKRALGITITDLFSHMPKNQQRNESGRLLFTSDPDYCCFLNKIQPMEPLLMQNDVWISGVRSSQSAVREQMKQEEPAKYGAMKYHPLLGWSSKMMYQYMSLHQLPRHPLEAEGYLSVGCAPCTKRIDPDALFDDRSGRWAGLKKSECGLHTDLSAVSLEK